MAQPIITLTTDFGYDSLYVGAMKGVIYSWHPAAIVVDLTHSVAPQNIRQGAFLVLLGTSDFPAGTVHLTVVDPGVGTDRRAVCLKVPEAGIFVGPDNGLFSYILDKYPDLTARQITNPSFMRPEISRTFHGRDIFGPTAARLAGGASFEAVGPLVEVATLLKLDHLWPEHLTGQVLHRDHYGNLITNFSRKFFAQHEIPLENSGVVVEDFYRIERFNESYGYAGSGEVIALFGSSGFLEIARVNGRADNHQGKKIEVGQTVRLLVKLSNG